MAVIGPTTFPDQQDTGGRLVGRSEQRRKRVTAPVRVEEQPQLGHARRLPWAQHKRISLDVCAEFFAQSQAEKRLGLASLPFMEKDPAGSLQELAPLQSARALAG